MAKSPPRFWARGEFMIWWIKSSNFPPLVTSGDFSDSVPGGLGSQGTSVLFGNETRDFFDRKGGRFSAGWWLDDDHRWGVDASYFFINGRAISASFESPGSPVLANPFFNVHTGVPDASLVTFPGIMSGQIGVEAPSFLQGAEANFTAAILHREHLRIDGLVGFRYLNLREGLYIDETSVVDLAPQYVGLIPLNGNTIVVSDQFDTNNHFFGPQLGLRAEWQHKRWFLGGSAKVALGVTRQVVTIGGSTFIDTQPAFASPGGLFAVSSNSGRFSRSAFGVVPEAGVNLGFHLTDNIRLFAGYTFLYWNSVARPGDQVDTNVNLNFVPSSTTFGAAGGEDRPAFSFRPSAFFAHGVNMGLELRY